LYHNIIFFTITNKLKLVGNLYNANITKLNHQLIKHKTAAT